MTSINSNSQGLSVIIEPFYSSFFAGQEFSTRITFKNNRIPIPQSQPLPSVERFGGQPSNLQDVRGNDSSNFLGPNQNQSTLDARRVVSASPGITSNINGHDHQNGMGLGSGIGESKNENNKPLPSSTISNNSPTRKRLIGPNSLSFENLSQNSNLDSTREQEEEERDEVQDRESENDHDPSLIHERKNRLEKLKIDTENSKSFGASKGSLNSPRKVENGADLGLGRPSTPKSASLAARKSSNIPSDASFSPASISSAPRRTSQQISSSHPHARKQSIMDSQSMALQDSFGPNNVPPPSPALSSTTSERGQKELYSLNENEEEEGYEDENATPRGGLNSSIEDFDHQGGFYEQGRNDTMESVVRDKMTDWSGIGLAASQRNGNGNGDRRSSISSNASSNFTNSSRTSNLPNKSKSKRQTQQQQVYGTETLLWSFAQLRGTCEVDETLIKGEDFERLKKRLAYGEGGGEGEKGTNLKGGRKILGGGEFDLGGGLGLNNMDNNGRIGNEDGWGSYLKSALWLSSSSSNSSSNQSPRSNSINFDFNDDSTPYSPQTSLSELPSTLSNGSISSSSGSENASSQKHKRTGSTMLDNHTRTLSSKSFPTFSMPPSMIAVDLVLKPGESKSFIFRTTLPSDLPPSFLGKSIKFNYSLGIGTNRLNQPPSSATRSYSSIPTRKSRLIQIPLRIYNHVGIQGFRPSFDLLNPVIRIKDEGICEEDFEDSNKIKNENEIAFSEEFSRRGGVRRKKEEKLKRKEKEIENQRMIKERKEIESYARSLLKEFENDENGSNEKEDDDDEKGNESLSPNSSKVRSPLSPLGRRALFNGTTDSGAGTGLPSNEDEIGTTCKSAIELLVRSSGKVSYDIAKDGKVAAVLTLIKSKYRLGDTVTGVVTINSKGAMARIVRVAATLETHEEIQPTLAMLPPGRSHKTTKRVHAEHHESTLDAGRAAFSLPIPGGATPEFVTSGVKLNWTLRLSFLTLSTFQDPTSVSSNSSESSSIKIQPPPPPHLVPSASDGFALYHTSYLAVPSLCGKLPTFKPSEAMGESPIDSNGFGKESKLEIVECAVPVTVLPHSSSFQVKPAHFSA